VGIYFYLLILTGIMTAVTLDNRGRLPLPKQLQERFGDRFRVVEHQSGIRLIPVAEDPLSALREEFEDVDKSVEELRGSRREEDLNEAGPWMYAEREFLLALIKAEGWLGESAEAVYRTHRDELWTSQFTLIELLLVAYLEDRDTERVVANAAELLEVRGDVDTVLAAASYVEQEGLAPFDALHRIKSTGDPTVSSDNAHG
jgi:bifunctional DNA-binding transcriptional regulator/antitoxin component of YhaV-PrlF toxin-antitoxin module